MSRNQENLGNEALDCDERASGYNYAHKLSGFVVQFLSLRKEAILKGFCRISYYETMWLKRQM
jgi:hypothetical protein